MSVYGCVLSQVLVSSNSEREMWGCLLLLRSWHRCDVASRTVFAVTCEYADPRDWWSWHRDNTISSTWASSLGCTTTETRYQNARFTGHLVSNSLLKCIRYTTNSLPNIILQPVTIYLVIRCLTSMHRSWYLTMGGVKIHDFIQYYEITWNWIDDWWLQKSIPQLQYTL